MQRPELEEHWHDWVTKTGAELLLHSTTSPYLRPPPAISFTLVDDDRFGAEAAPGGDGQYHIRLFSGSIFLLGLFWNEAFANAKTFPTTGDPSLEIVTSPSLPQLYNDAMHFRFAADEQGDRALNLPKCPQRRRAADVMTRTALQLLLCHEIVHVLGGHVALRSAIAKGVELQLAEEERLALEFDADGCAVARMILMSFRGGVDTGSAKFFEKCGRLVGAAYATQLLFHPPLDQALPTNNYISSMTRSVAFFASVTTYLLVHLDDAKLAAVGAAGNSVIRQIEQARAFVTGVNDAAERIARFDEFARIVPLPAFTTARAGWNSVRERLVRFAFVEPAPEDQIT